MCHVYRQGWAASAKAQTGSSLAFWKSNEKVTVTSEQRREREGDKGLYEGETLMHQIIALFKAHTDPPSSNTHLLYKAEQLP